MAAVLGVSLVFPLVLTAQSPPALPDSLATITTDTGDFKPGPTDFSHYGTPGICLAAARHLVEITRRSIAAQEAADVLQRTNPVQDTLPAKVAEGARLCGRRFTAATTPATDLPDLFALALLMQDDSLARAVLARRIALAPMARLTLLEEAVGAYLAAEPARVAAAEQVTAQLDAMGRVALGAQLRAHTLLKRFGDAMFDSARMTREATQLIKLTHALSLTHTLSGDEATAYSRIIAWAYKSLMAVAFVQAPDSMPAIARRAQQDLSRIPAPPGQRNGWAAMPLASILTQLSPVGNWQALGQPTPTLRADDWFPAQATDTVQPRAGRVALFVEVPEQCYAGNDVRDTPVLDPIGNGCAPLYSQLRQWHGQYGAAGLDITLVAATSAVSGTVLSGPQPPPAAAANLAWFFREYLHLPVRLAVQRLPVMPPLPAPDGRAFVVDTLLWPYFHTPFDDAYFDDAFKWNTSAWWPRVVLTDRTGREVYTGTAATQMGAQAGADALFETVLRQTMTVPTLTAPPSSAPGAGAAPGAPAVPRPSAAGPAASPRPLHILSTLSDTP